MTVNPIIEGILRVEASNDRTNWVKMHKPSLGPYDSANPKVCQDCGKSLDGVPGGEPCPNGGRILRFVKCNCEQYKGTHGYFDHGDMAHKYPGMVVSVRAGLEFLTTAGVPQVEKDSLVQQMTDAGLPESEEHDMLLLEYSAARSIFGEALANDLFRTDPRLQAFR